MDTTADDLVFAVQTLEQQLAKCRADAAYLHRFGSPEAGDAATRDAGRLERAIRAISVMANLPGCQRSVCSGW